MCRVWLYVNVNCEPQQLEKQQLEKQIVLWDRSVGMMESPWVEKVSNGEDSLPLQVQKVWGEFRTMSEHTWEMAA